MDEIFNPINYEENNCDFIFQYKNTKVFLSDYTTSHKNDYLMENNIKYIINATIKYPNFFKNTIKYLRIPIRNRSVYVSELYKKIPNIFNFFDKCVENESNILIHCKRGHRRSATIVCILLLKYKHINVEDSVGLVKNIRPNSFKQSTKINEILKYLPDFKD